MVPVQPVYSDLVSVLGQGVVLVQPVYSDLVSVLGQGVVLVQHVYSDLVSVLGQGVVLYNLCTVIWCLCSRSRGGPCTACVQRSGVCVL